MDNAKALKVADEEAMHHEAMKDRIFRVCKGFPDRCAFSFAKMQQYVPFWFCLHRYEHRSESWPQALTNGGRRSLTQKH